MRANRTMPACTAIPQLVYDEVGEAIEWLCATFGFTERWRAGNHRAHHRTFSGSTVDVVPKDRGGTSAAR